MPDGIIAFSSDHPLAKAMWIWPTNYEYDLHNAYALFRKSFKLEASIQRAPLFITADQSYQLYVNGTFATRGPARGFQETWPFDEIDIAPLLKPGSNVLSIRVYNPGYSTYQYISQGNAGLLAAAGWKGAELVTDASWLTRSQTGIRKDTVPATLHLPPQEHIDLRDAQLDWQSPAYDDASWHSPYEVLRVCGAQPWSTLEPRGLPQLYERAVTQARALGISEGDSVAGYREARDACRLMYDERPVFQKADRSLAVRPVRFEATGEGGYQSILLDFGKCHVGNFELRIADAKGSEIVDIIYTETIDPNTLQPHLAYPTHCKLALASRLVCRSGANRHRFYHPYGFRYATMIVRDSLSSLEIDWILHTIGYPIQRRGRFASSDRTLEAIWETCAWSQQVCSLDAFVDTPWREQAQWWGDACVQSQNFFHLDGDTRLFRRGIRQIGQQTAPNGLTYGHAPTIAHFCVLPDFALSWISSMADYHWQTGSFDAFRENEPKVAAAFEYFRRQSEAVSLVGHDPRYWLFLDWTELFKDGYPTVLNLQLLRAIDHATALYDGIGRPSEAKAYRDWGKQLRTELLALVDQDGLIRDGYDWSGNAVASKSIHAQTLAIMTRLDPANDAPRIQRSLLDFIRSPVSGFKGRPSAFFVTHLYEVLSDRGYGEDVVAHIRANWEPMVSQGATWEDYDDFRYGVKSFSHAWSAHPLFHLIRIVGGIRQTAAAWTRIRFAPVFIGDHGESTVPSPRGRIRSSWKRQERSVAVRLDLPEGVEAEVRLPGCVETLDRSKSWEIPLERAEELATRR